MSLAEARSLWSLVQIDEFIYSMLLSDKVYTPKILGTCGHLFALEKVIHPHLPFDDKQGIIFHFSLHKINKFFLELYSSSERPNWFQRTRIAIGIIEYFSDTWLHQDTDQHIYLCQPLFNAFGFDKDYESKVN
jgi:hypothetical protein